MNAFAPKDVIMVVHNSKPKLSIDNLEDGTLAIVVSMYNTSPDYVYIRHTPNLNFDVEGSNNVHICTAIVAVADLVYIGKLED